MTDTSSQLAETGRAVQHRAASIALNLDRPDAAAHLRQVIDDEIRTWEDDHRRGTRAHALLDPVGIARRSYRDIAEHGPLTDLLGQVIGGCRTSGSCCVEGGVPS